MESNQGSTESRPTRVMERFPRNKTSRIEPLNLVGTARCAVRAAFSGATPPPADSRAGTSQRDVPAEVRFIEGIKTADQTFVCVGVSRFNGVKLPFSQHCTNPSVTAFNYSQRARMVLDSCLVI